MAEVYTVKLGELIDEFSLDVLYLPEAGRDVLISRADIYRPGLPLTGFFEHFDPSRIQIFGRTECGYLESKPLQERRETLRRFLEKAPVAIIVTHELILPEGCVELISEFKIPLLATREETSAFMASLISALNVKLAERITRHGVFVEVYGEGIFLTGDSGIGKSETAIELVKRGHRLIADDAVEIKKVSSRTLVGSAPELIRHYIELRGIGIVDVRRIFGMGSVKMTEKIDLVINLEHWDKNKFYDRLGMDTEYTNIMGIDVPSMTIPVKPGRNLAVILEIAAMNNRQKKMGYNSAEEFNARLMHQFETEEEAK
ncbi:MAG: HPr(Ser) kinase/phosphatase [Clostridia bacterium]|nr:HPr(Ser) kinase/phosphatase [Clostridia bacterium]